MEGTLPTGHFIEDDPEGEDVGAVVDSLSLHLFGRHAGNGSHHHSLLGLRPGDDLGVEHVFLNRFEDLGQSEVEDFRTTLLGHHDVRRLQVPMGDAFVVGGCEGIGERYPDIEEPCQVHSFFGYELLE